MTTRRWYALIKDWMVYVKVKPGRKIGHRQQQNLDLQVPVVMKG